MSSGNSQNHKGKGSGNRDTVESIIDKYGSERSSGRRSAEDRPKSGKSKELEAPRKVSSGDKYFRPSSSLLESPPRSCRDSSDSDNTKAKKRGDTLNRLEGKSGRR
ncbi:hypothetical protein BPAE_0191g00110 [Botrytis paeoniae]|uniref:Uncharacterized protein n=1 Tax=Botrytis paeoniae TaxID=278948 RepID=A0A4Z1FGM1_9HELO|nr:hypothetical protein BPAE_0191g00110 [Botrytis paeoniae]